MSCFIAGETVVVVGAQPFLTFWKDVLHPPEIKLHKTQPAG
jgi:hypothetical protein